MVKTEKSITIQRPIAEVFAYLSNLENGPQWQSGLLEVRRTTQGPLGVGAQFTAARKFLGRRMEGSMEMSAYEPNRSFAIKSSSGSTPFEQTFLFEPVAGGVRLTSEMQLQTSGIMGLAEPLIASGVKREFEADFGTLKDLLESQTVAA